jgi:acyl transferase domain-containing protein
MVQVVGGRRELLLHNSSDGSRPCMVVGASCWYAGAPDLRALWEAVLTQRTGFRRIPAERLSLRDYGLETDSAHDAADRTYVSKAAVIDGFSFD